MNFPYVMRRINRVFTNRLLGPLAWILPPLAVVVHVGRKSGRQYHSPVVAFKHRHGFVIPLTYGRDVDWAQNLLASGGGEVVQMGVRHRLSRPRIVGNEEARRYLPWVARFLLSANLPGYVLLERGS